MIRVALWGLGLMLLTTSCANTELGRSLPECEGDVTATMVILIQSVPEAEFVPCINELKLGWEYIDLVPKLGDTRFWISSDRIGDRFLEVILTEECSVDQSQDGIEIRQGVTQYRDVAVVRPRAVVVVSALTGDMVPYAEEVGDLLELSIEHRIVTAIFDGRSIPLAEKIDAAHGTGAALVFVEQQDELNSPSTAGLALPGEAAIRPGVELDEVVSLIGDHLAEPSFRGEWITVVDGGCITYRFDAKGPEVAGLTQTITEALGLFPSRELQQQLRDAGVIG